MARCNSCNLLCSQELQDADMEFDLGTCTAEEVTITAEGELELVSGCCGDTTASTSLEIEETFTITHADDCPYTATEEDGDDPEEPEYEITEQSFEPTDWYEGSNPKTGKPYSPRYQKHFYGVDYSAEVTCKECDAKAEVSGQAGEQASYWDAY